MPEQPIMTDYNAAMSGTDALKDMSKENPMQMPMMRSKKNASFLPVLLVALVLGVGSGYLLWSKVSAAKPMVKQSETGTETTATSEKKVKVGDVFGSTDASTFKDAAEGVLLAGGVNGEGSHHIVREGGESQTVYLTSSIVDLNMFIDHKVAVRGETFKAQRAGWLMDVGQVKVLELNAQLPDWAQKAAEKAELQKGDGN